MPKKLKLIDLGKKDYQETYKIQLETYDKIKQGKQEDTLILVEHPPVLTIGRKGTEENIIVQRDFLKKQGIEVYEIDRGGDVTYHGPGQIVGYPILNLRHHQKDIHWLMRSYEGVFIRLLKNEYNLNAVRIEGLTGVWINHKKITALGVGVRKWITIHGFAFNVKPNLEHFNYIIPCGISDKGVTSLKNELPVHEFKMAEVKQQVVKYFLDVFEMELIKDVR